MKNKKLTFFQGISLSIGSIIGSGVLFLPSLTVHKAGADALLGWALIIILSIPGIFFFKDLFVVSKDKGISGFVSLGLGDCVGSSIPLILLGTVIFGMPSSCLIASDYVAKVFPSVHHSGFLVATALVVISSGLAMKGINTSAKINSAVTIILILIAIIICCFSTINIDRSLVPEFTYNYENIFQVGVLSFWAFAGFENLTFLANDFENENDLVRSILIALVVCGAIYLFLTLDILMLIQKEDINPNSGLIQLSGFIPPVSVSKFLIAIFAFVAVFVNMISWTSGISKAVVTSANEGYLPKIFSRNSNNIAKPAITLLLVCFLINIYLGYTSPKVFSKVLSLVSSNFLVVYLLILLSFFKISKSKLKKAFSLVIALGVLISLLSSPLLLIYPICIIVYVFLRKRVMK